MPGNVRHLRGDRPVMTFDRIPHPRQISQNGFASLQKLVRPPQRFRSTFIYLVEMHKIVCTAAKYIPTTSVPENWMKFPIPFTQLQQKTHEMGHQQAMKPHNISVANYYHRYDNADNETIYNKHKSIDFLLSYSIPLQKKVV